MTQALRDRKIAVVAADGFEKVELTMARRHVDLKSILNQCASRSPFPRTYGTAAARYVEQSRRQRGLVGMQFALDVNVRRRASGTVSR